MSDVHDASASALGYLYQVNWALLELLRLGPNRPDHGVFLEKYDDVSWEVDHSPTEVLQIKHHEGPAKNLSDKSVDLWKTLKVWMDNPLLAHSTGPELCIVTTAAANEGSAAWFMRTEGRDVMKARRLLDDAALSSENVDTKSARDAWLRLSDLDRINLVSRVIVLDAAPNVSGLHDEVREALYWAAPSDPFYRDLFLSEVIGWWHRVAIDMLKKTRGPVTAVQVSRHLDESKALYRPGSLPETIDRIVDDEGGRIAQQYSTRLFVTQLGFINISTRAVQLAILDYHNAVAQTTDWLDRSLLDMSEFDRFKEALAEEWEWAFEAVMSELSADTPDAERERLGRELFFKLRDSSRVLHESYRHQFYTSGVQLEIADDGRHGWHPDFADLVAALTIDKS